LIIREELLRGNSLANATIIAAYACTSHSNFKELMVCFLSPEYRVAQRAAGAVSICVKNDPLIIQMHIHQIVTQLTRLDVNDSVKRNSLRMLQEVEIPEEFHGEIMNACFAFIEDPATPVAIKAFSLTILYNLSEQYPEIKSELQLIIEERLATETAAFKARARKILGKLTH
jgi:hypothetical protein